jgi:hypothetical protein
VSDAPRRDPATEQREDATSAAGPGPIRRPPSRTRWGPGRPGAGGRSAMPAEREAPPQDEGAAEQDDPDRVGAASRPRPRTPGRGRSCSPRSRRRSSSATSTSTTSSAPGRSSRTTAAAPCARAPASATPARPSSPRGCSRCSTTSTAPWTRPRPREDESLAKGVQLVAEKLVGACGPPASSGSTRPGSPSTRTCTRRCSRPRRTSLGSSRRGPGAAARLPAGRACPARRDGGRGAVSGSAEHAGRGAVSRDRRTWRR